MEHLPIELRRSIISNLSLASLKNLRLTCRIWAALGEDYLISPNFTTLPHADSISRLSSLSSSPKYNQRIRSLLFNHGEMNDYHARHNTYFLQYMQDPEARMESLTSTWGAYAPLKTQKDSYLPISYEVHVLTPILANLPNVSAIAVTLLTCPFPANNPDTELLREIWGIPSTRLLPRVATTERFTNMLTAVVSNSSSMTLKDLSHDRLPFEFFAQKSAVISSLSPAFRNLTKLELGLDYSEMPNNLHSRLAFQNLSHFLRSAEGLQQLAVRFFGRKKIDISPLLSSFSEHVPILKNLSQLKMGGILSTERELGGFLVGLKALERLQLGDVGIRGRYQLPVGGVHLREGSWRGLFRRVLGEMDLKSFCVQGDIAGLESGECWYLEGIEKASEIPLQ